MVEKFQKYFKGMLSFLTGKISVHCCFFSLGEWIRRIYNSFFVSLYLFAIMIIHLLLGFWQKEIPTGRVRSPCIFALLNSQE